VNLKEIWHDPVWSKVIATVILGGISAIAAVIFPTIREFLGASSLVPHWALLSAALLFLAIILAVAQRSKPRVKITQTDVSILEDPTPGRSFPLKVYCEMRNDSHRAVNVRLCPYIPDAVKVTRFTPGALQLKFPTGWLPQPDGLERVAVLPEQTFKAWVAPDETLFNKASLDGLRGQIGTLVLNVDGQEIKIAL
jgi:hypothetical protein